MAEDAVKKVDVENEIPMDVRNISYGGRKLTPEERNERRRKRREEKIARGEPVGDSDESDDDFDDEEEEAEEIQEGLTELKIPKLNFGKVMETDIDAAEDTIYPRKVRFGGQLAAPPGQPQAGSVISTPRSVTTDELEARLEDLRRQTDRILYVLDCMDTRLGGPGLPRAPEAPSIGFTAAVTGPMPENGLGPISPGSSFRSQPDSIGPELIQHGSAFSPQPGANGRAPPAYGFMPSVLGAPSARPHGSSSGFVGFTAQKSRWGPLGKGSGLGALADPGSHPNKMSEVQYIEQQTQCLLRDLEALQSIVIPPPGTSNFNLEPRAQVTTRSPLRRTQSMRAPRSAGRPQPRSYGALDPPGGPINNSWEYLTSLIQIRRSVVGVTDRLRPMDYVMARGRR